MEKPKELVERWLEKYGVSRDPRVKSAGVGAAGCLRGWAHSWVNLCVIEKNSTRSAMLTFVLWFQPSFSG